MAGLRYWSSVPPLLLISVLTQLVGSQFNQIRERRQSAMSMPQITGLDVTCEKSGMSVSLEFSAPFNGVIFSKGHFSNPACRYVKKNSNTRALEITIPLSSCGTQTVESSTDRLMIENTIIIQADPMVQDSWDAARKITCDWQSKLEKMVTFAPFAVADLLQVAEVKFASSGDNVRTRMEIQFGRGPFAQPLEGLTKIGDELTVVVYAEDGGAGYDMMVKNCFAYDGTNFKTANKIQLLNEHGCLFRPHQMEYFQRTVDTRSTGANIIAFARMNAFKFPDKMDVFLSCELELCKGGCDSHCEMEDYPIDIIEHLPNSPHARALPEAEAVATTFRPAQLPKLKKVLKGVKRKKVTKEFGRDRIDDDALGLLSPPVTLSPELMELLVELGAESRVELSEPSAMAHRTDKPQGMTIEEVPQTSERSTPSQPSNLVDSGKLAFNQPSNMGDSGKVTFNQPSNLGDSGKVTFNQPSSQVDSGKLTFSTIFAGTHSVSNAVPPTIIDNQEKFKPSQLLSASIEANPVASLSDTISSLSRGSSGQTSVQFPPRLSAPNNSARLTNSLEAETSGARSSDSTAARALSQIIHFPADDFNSNSFASGNSGFAAFSNINANANVFGNSLTADNEAAGDDFVINNDAVAVGTLQQQLKTETHGIVCSSGSLDPRCSNPASAPINFSQFKPISTTPNILTSTLVFTSPRSVEHLQQKLLQNPETPKKVLLKIVDAVPEVARPSRHLDRPRFGTRLAANSARFAQFFGARKRRAATEDEEEDDESVDNVFARETINMVKGFQVVSAADLAFEASGGGDKAVTKTASSDHDGEICFAETSFYSGLLVSCSLLLLSGLVSIFSIRRVRLYQKERKNKLFFGRAISDSYQ